MCYRSNRKQALAMLVMLFLTCASACLHERFLHTSSIKKRDTPLTPLSSEEAILVNAISNTTISQWSYYYTHGAHLAGKNMSMAEWTADHWRESGWNSSIVSYDVYINYPINKSLSLVYSNGTTYTPDLEEAVLNEDETTSYPNRIPTFHGYSANGSVNAEFVYVGRGQQVDFDRLNELGVPLEGKVAVAKYGGPFRGLKVKNAQENGMIGVIIFTDTSDDGNITEANGFAAYPDGPARNPSAVQRGSVEFLSTYPGDPTTPGYPSKEGSPRGDPSPVLPKIPSIPISYVNAIPILAALDGQGTPGTEVNRTGWVGALNVSYSTGPAPGTTISMSNFMEDKYTPIWNSIGIINGTIADETIVIGNHRDAWIIGGAADPNSGTAIIVELAKAFGELLSQGWRPKRNIVLASWDGEEYGLLGSTEWVEEYVPWLSETTVSYLNIDVGASGPWPYIEATPELHTIATDIMKKVLWMNTNRTMYDVWLEYTEGSIGVLGSGSDYTSFVHNGIGSIDMSAGPGATDPIYHYHSNFDSYHWMTTFGDPSFLAHKSMAQYLTLLAYNLSNDDLIQFDLPNYGTQLEKYYDDLISTINSNSQDLDTSMLQDAIEEFKTGATEVQAAAQQAIATNDSDLLTLVNHKYRDFQRGFVSQGGLPNREFYRHLIFAPGLDTGYAATTFPGITEAVEAQNTSLATQFLQKTADAILVAANIIKT
ncbi:glutamate carboxypeptidase [Annulohypoxylon truncatum]|uniref:glutamate carboxypeptidase n=1 Tax=Annulohypoxylon truncatum TaxID=327061 RepID=UPI0020089274|nr:glutamate carboxypeptidase [Annulohypoxylon truncatum]KAI1208045.1 glutamate carboxypeptidase [Annulohypoxylon truncatum]